MTEQATIDRLADAVTMLRETWLEVSSIQHGRALLEAARPALARFGDYSAFIRQWHYGSVLSAARRMLDDRKDVRSAVRGLRVIAAKIQQLDKDGLVALHAATRETDLTAEAEADARQAFHTAATLQTDDDARIPRRPADEHVAELLHDHEHVTELVNHAIAHRRDAFAQGRIVVGVPPLDEDAIDTVLDDLIAAAAEWTRLLAGAEVHIRDRDPNPRHLFVRALELFDPDTYLEAIMQRDAQLGPWAAPATYDAVERDVHTRYVWPDDDH